VLVVVEIRTCFWPLARFYEFKISQRHWGLLYQAQTWRLFLVGRYATGKRYIYLWQKDAGGEWYINQFLG
jgi:hypothetical protein